MGFLALFCIHARVRNAVSINKIPISYHKLSRPTAQSAEDPLRSDPLRSMHIKILKTLSERHGLHISRYMTELADISTTRTHLADRLNDRICRRFT